MSERERAAASPWVVLKFGGTSVAGRAQWETIAVVVRARQAEGLRVALVCSALVGVSNAIEALLEQAVGGGCEAALEAIIARHREVGAALEVDADAALGEAFATLRRLAQGVGLLGEVSPRVMARAMAQGELMATRLGAAYLGEVAGVAARWVDARGLLTSAPVEGESARRRYLSAVCDDARDEAMTQALEAGAPGVIVTQGFIARDPQGATVLLGRGGSDTSAAYLAARLGARRCEIWTDVPGMFTANPRLLPDARLLRALDYDEAQEIASTGAKVLHPRCLSPLRPHRIPLWIKCASAPEMEGTQIGPEGADDTPQVKAISARVGLTLISMDTLGMWQQVGFLADVFTSFKRRGLSVDLVSTSESNVTVSLDPVANALDEATVEALLEDLSRHCRARRIERCAAISLVGRGIRAILHRLGSALELFEEQRVHLLSQAANDLNLTVVVDEEQATRLVRELHWQLFRGRGKGRLLGPSWRALFDPDAVDAGRARRAPWWEGARDALLAVAARQAPCYVYDAATLEAAAGRVMGLGSVARCFYAVKANNHPRVLRVFERAGLGFECVSPGELARVREALPELAPERLLFTPNFAPRQEYEAAFALGAWVTLDNLHPLETWPEVFAGQALLARLDPGQGRGHHQHVKTAGARSKFGVAPDQLDTLVALVEAAGARVVGLHAHAGSGVQAPESWRETALFLAAAAERFRDVQVLNVGGGLGVPERPGQPPLDMRALDAALAEVRSVYPGYELWMEPGRYLVAPAGVLLARVTQLKRKGELVYVGVEAGMNSLIRPALYGAYHEIVNLSRLGEPRTQTATIVGPICESGDTLGYNRRIAPAREGDVLLIATAGAYGRVMSSRYNLREPATEVFIEAGG